MSSHPPEGMEFLTHDAPGPSRRLLLLVGLLAGLVLATGLLLDRHVRSTEAAAVERCADRAYAAVARQESGVGAMAAYVRPALYGHFQGAVGEGLVEMISTEAVRVVGSLSGVREECAAVAVLPFHDVLQARKAACLGFLDSHATFLERVAADGSVYYRDSPGLGHDC